MIRANVVDCLTRKRIWEVDCTSLDAAIAASFDWRGLVNLLEGSGHRLRKEADEELRQVQTYRMIHQHCHSENSVSLAIENFLNQWHTKTIAELGGMTLAETARFVVCVKLDSKRLAGTIWAIGTDARDNFDCIRRCFNQRLQIFSIRRLQA